MSNPEEMQERFPKLPPDRGHCYQCNGGLGLIRHRLGLKSFCSSRCLTGYKADTERKLSLIKERRDIGVRKP
jgi:hypothetical protein